MLITMRRASSIISTLAVSASAFVSGRLFFICSGGVKVSIAGREVAQLEAGNFVGEVAFLTERPATATVIAERPVPALAFERGKLNQFFKNETEGAGLIYQLIGRELAHKIKVSNSLLAAVNSFA